MPFMLSRGENKGRHFKLFFRKGQGLVHLNIIYICFTEAVTLEGTQMKHRECGNL